MAPTQRPHQRARGFQRWRCLLFAHWPVEVDQIRPLVPPPLELDLHQGKAYVGLVPFAMSAVRPWWLPSALGFNFLEANVRTYVFHKDRPGVYFFSLDAASALAVQIARRFWGLPYHHAQMTCTRDGDVVHYQMRRSQSGSQHEVKYRVGKTMGISQPETLEYFLLERYLLFTVRKHRAFVGQVHHAPYPVRRAEILHMHDELLAAAHLDCPGPPPIVHYSPGVDVEIFRLQAIK